MDRKNRLSRKIFPFLSWADDVTGATIRGDLLAGVTNAFVVLPQGVAFAMIAGLPPEYGLYTAIIPPIIAALFGSSHHLISGPTTAISIVLFSTISPYSEPGSAHFIALALTLTFLAGLMQFALGLVRMGVLVNFISHTVVIGFTAGAAIIIATSQIKHCLGIKLPNSGSFIYTWIYLLESLPQTNPYALFTAVLTIAVVVFLKRARPAWPGMLIGMVAAGIAAFLLGAEEKGIALVGSIPSSLPPLSLPDFSPQALSAMTSGALAVSMLGLIEAVSIARSIAIKSHQRIDGNQEFIGQGLSNMVGSFFSCYASSGSFTRSGINYAAGAKTPMAAVFAAVSLALILFVVAPLAAYLPIPAMGGIVLVVAYKLIDIHHIKAVFRASGQESAVMAVTFFSTLFVQLEFAIYVGVIMSLILYLKETSQPRIVSRMPDPKSESRMFVTDPDIPECAQMKIIRIDGSIYYGSVDHVVSALDHMERESPEQKHLLMVCNGINMIDVAGAEMLVHEAHKLRERGGDLYLYGVKEKVCGFLRKGGYMDEIGEGNVFRSKELAIKAITSALDKDECRTCPDKVFQECRVSADEEKQSKNHLRSLS